MEENVRSVTSVGGFIPYIKGQLHLQDVDPKTYSPLTLAYIGDGVYELIIRTLVVNHGNVPVSRLHKKSSSLVKAGTQALIMIELLEDLTEAELVIYKRGRNAKSATMAKNATVIDYRTATGFEALIGYLYVTEEFNRMIELVKIGLTKIGELK
ncbi:MAG: ribonuclease III [Clostridiales bacterium]|nr:ribonuclease III [Clostridiales bacterium]